MLAPWPVPSERSTMVFDILLPRSHPCGYRLIQCGAVTTTAMAAHREERDISSLCFPAFSPWRLGASSPGADCRSGELGQPCHAAATRTWDVARPVDHWRRVS